MFTFLTSIIHAISTLHGINSNSLDYNYAIAKHIPTWYNKIPNPPPPLDGDRTDPIS